MNFCNKEEEQNSKKDKNKNKGKDKKKDKENNYKIDKINPINPSYQMQISYKIQAAM
jgi:hypothetical protein